MFHKILFCRTAALVVLLASITAKAQLALPLDPHRTWKIIETTHFEIIYAQEDKGLALKFAAEAERAERLLGPYLKTTMPTKVPLVIGDTSDSANGSATGIPQSEIQVYPVLPVVSDTTGEYYDWPRELVQHEFTHILNFEPTSGFMSVLRFLFGSLIKPGGYLPTWYLEGLAVEMESRLTPLGRGRSLYYSAFVRSQVEDGAWGIEGLDRLGAQEIPTWPRGSRPYTYGYFLMHELSQIPRLKSQHEPVYSFLDHAYGGRIPWFLDGPVKDYFGKTYSELLNMTYSALRMRAQSQIQMIKKEGLENGTPMPQPGYFTFGAQVSPDGLKMAAIISEYDHTPAIRIWKRASKDQPFELGFDVNQRLPDPIISSKDIHQLSWREDSKTIVFDHTRVWNHYNTYNDLYELNAETGMEKPLTDGLRAREATVMPDGSLVFVQATSHNTLLSHSTSDGKNVTVLLNPSNGDRLSSPRPFGKGIIYSHRDNKGREWIESLNLETGQVKKLTESPNPGDMSIMPVPDLQNASGFYFASGHSGVMNIYHDDGVSVRAVTNVTTYAMSPAYDPGTNTLLFSRLTSKGFELEKIPVKHLAQPVQVARINSYPKAIESEADPATTSEEKDYNGAKYLFPQLVYPFIYFVPGGALFQLNTFGSDPLNHHQYSATVGYDTRANQPTEEITYTNGSWPFYIDATLMNEYIYIVGAGNTEHVLFGEIDTRHYLFPDSNKWLAGPEFSYQETDYFGLNFAQFGPGFAISWNNVSLPRDYQISPEGGESVMLGYDYYFVPYQTGGANTSFGNVRGNASFYLSGRPLPEHHVLSFKGSAWFVPQLQNIVIGSQQAGGEYLLSLLPPSYLVRGYPVGEFIGWQVFTGSLEYRFPIFYQYHGVGGNFPIFFNKWHGALFGDMITLQGDYYDTRAQNLGPIPSNLGTTYVGTGGELRSDLTVAYHYDLTMRIGMYYGLNQYAYGGWSWMVSFGSVQ